MSSRDLSIIEAQKVLTTFDEIENQPEKIFTELFMPNIISGVAITRVLSGIQKNRKSAFEHIANCVKQIPIFDGCDEICCRGYDIEVWFPDLQPEESFYASNKMKDWKAVQCLEKKEVPFIRTMESQLISINVNSKTFRTYKRFESCMHAEMSREVSLKHEELSQYWKRFEDLSLPARIKQAFLALKKSLWRNKLGDFLFWIFFPKKKISEKYNAEVEKIEEMNKENEQRYAYSLARREFYKKYAPEHIERRKSKQKEITQYLLSLGYKEEKYEN